jgi:drug/metabolite transporter (DMT)-like permease
LNIKAVSSQVLPLPLPFPAPSERLVYVGLIALQVVFALGYILSKVLVDEFPPLMWGWIRAGITASFMAVISIVLKRPHPPLNRKFFVPLIWLSLLGGVLTQVFFLVGLKYTTSTNSAILNTLNPLVTLMTVVLMGREKATSLRLFGFMVSFCGVLVLSGAERIRVAQSTLFGDLLTIGSCITYGVFVAVSKDFFKKYDRFWITTWLFVFTTLGLTFFAIPYMTAFQWPLMTPMLWGSFIYGILGSSLLGYFLIVWVVAHAPASKVALFDYLQPILVTILAAIFLMEKTTLRTLGGSALIFVGVFLTLERLPAGFRISRRMS